jgi:hypothetical protein
VTVSIAFVTTAAQETTTSPLRLVLVGLGRHHPWVIELCLHPVGVDQHISRAHGVAFLSWLAPWPAFLFTAGGSFVPVPAAAAPGRATQLSALKLSSRWITAVGILRSRWVAGDDGPA